jgi:hypothetical protein
MRHRALNVVALCVGALSVGTTACNVPSVSFYPDDGGTSAGEAGTGADAAHDADGADGAESTDALPGDGSLGDGPADDGALDGGCSVEVLAEASTCCGSIVCQGDCTGQCSACEQKCSAPQVCCVHNQSVSCHGPGPCP